MAEGGVDVLHLLIRHELAIKELYDLFARAFPDRQELWLRLAGDEQRHADLLGTLLSEPALDVWLMRDTPLKPPAIRASIGYVENQIARAREGGLTLVQALSIARDLENALLEKQLGRLGESRSEQIRSVVRSLVAETAGHRVALADAMVAHSRHGS